ncbi:LemA family protein [Verrucomicrobiaceae bacterium N1E253]|uniref:LemA family protein n=2 Tax=Oceaniferula marina TaxID=2748318 RepID=A0A851GBN0_9BACT|nr:LemA family protein [Oceaniferula marina]
MLVAVMYNGHVNRRNAVNYAYASIDVQLKKRWDLIPNLVETVKGYTRHEKELLETLTRARRQAKDLHDDSHDRFSGESQINQAVPQLLALAESYPELKADKQFLNLQRNLTEVEAQIAAARRAYNAAVMDYNNGVDMFPSSIIASLFGFARRHHFATKPSERDTPNVAI